MGISGHHRSAVWLDEIPATNFLDEYWQRRAQEPRLEEYKRLLTGDWSPRANETHEEEVARLKRLVKNLSKRVDEYQGKERLQRAVNEQMAVITKEQAIKLKDLTLAVRAWVDLAEGMFLSGEGRDLARTLREAVSEVETCVFPDGFGPVEAVQRMRQILADTA